MQLTEQPDLYTDEELAIIHDYLMGHISAADASRQMNLTNYSSFHRHVSEVVRQYIAKGKLRFTPPVETKDDLRRILDE